MNIIYSDHVVCVKHYTRNLFKMFQTRLCRQHERNSELHTRPVQSSIHESIILKEKCRQNCEGEEMWQLWCYATFDEKHLNQSSQKYCRHYEKPLGFFNIYN